MMRNLLVFMVPLVFFAACKKEAANDLEGYQPKFVVEGWIEEGGYPYVMLSHNLPFFTAVDSAQLSEVVIRWAKVSVSDGTTTEVLTGMKDKTYFPPYGYRGSEIKGVAGKTYLLKIEYAGEVLNAETTIPKKPKLDSIWFSPKENGQQQLNVKFKDPQDEVNYYRFYTKTAKDQLFYATMLATQTDKYFNGKELSLQLNRGPENNLKLKNKTFFDTGDTVFIKFAAIPKSGFDFWSTFGDEVLNASNPLIGSTGKVSHNIEGPAIGIWCGYNSAIYKKTAK